MAETHATLQDIDARTGLGLVRARALRMQHKFGKRAQCDRNKNLRNTSRRLTKEPAHYIRWLVNSLSTLTLHTLNRYEGHRILNPSATLHDQRQSVWTWRIRVCQSSGRWFKTWKKCGINIRNVHLCLFQRSHVLLSFDLKLCFKPLSTALHLIGAAWSKIQQYLLHRLDLAKTLRGLSVKRGLVLACHSRRGRQTSAGSRNCDETRGDRAGWETRRQRHSRN